MGATAKVMVRPTLALNQTKSLSAAKGCRVAVKRVRLQDARIDAVRLHRVNLPGAADVILIMRPDGVGQVDRAATGEQVVPTVETDLTGVTRVHRRVAVQGVFVLITVERNDVSTVRFSACHRKHSRSYRRTAQWLLQLTAWSLKPVQKRTKRVEILSIVYICRSSASGELSI
jgi:hypothetical protein